MRRCVKWKRHPWIVLRLPPWIQRKLVKHTDFHLKIVYEPAMVHTCNAGTRRGKERREVDNFKPIRNYRAKLKEAWVT